MTYEARKELHSEFSDTEVNWDSEGHKNLMTQSQKALALTATPIYVVPTPHSTAHQPLLRKCLGCLFLNCIM